MQWSVARGVSKDPRYETQRVPRRRPLLDAQCTGRSGTRLVDADPGRNRAWRRRAVAPGAPLRWHELLPEDLHALARLCVSWSSSSPAPMSRFFSFRAPWTSTLRRCRTWDGRWHRRGRCGTPRATLGFCRRDSPGYNGAGPAICAGLVPLRSATRCTVSAGSVSAASSRTSFCCRSPSPGFLASSFSRENHRSPEAVYQALLYHHADSAVKP